MSRSAELFQRAKIHIPGGVNSPVRAFRAVGGDPIFFQRGEGAYLIDSDDRHYIDYVGSWGPLVLGHAHPEVIQAVVDAARSGLSFGTPTEIEIALAAKISELMPSLEKVRMVSSGTEATMSALRLARGFTDRNRIVKFEGCYHGHSDALLVKAGSGALTFGVPTSPGVPDSVAEHTMTLTFNDIEQVRNVFADLGDTVAAIIVEPVAGNMSCIPPRPGFLEVLREVCDEHGAVLIFDEVMTGFRVELGGAQALYDVKPDLTTLGKVIGGGMPVGAFGGRAEIMDRIAPDGPVYQAGTLSGNPVTMAAGLTTLNVISRQPDFYKKLGHQTTALLTGIRAAAGDAQIPLLTNQVGTMFGLFFTEAPSVQGFSDVMACSTERFATFFRAMLAEGVYLAPSAFESGFVSAAHGNTEIEATVDATVKAMTSL